MSGPVPAWISLRVGDAGAIRAFYGDILGLVVESDGGGMRMTPPGGRDPILRAEVDRGAEPAEPGSAGLYHMAFKVPARADLARVYRQLRLGGVPIRGAADHGVSEALYLEDPEGNGVEVYVDRPEEEWIWKDGEIQMTTEPLDGTGLLATADGEGGLPAGSELGHVHLRTADLAGAVEFWTGAVGLEVTTRAWPGAAFLASDRYHHHLGLNEWGGPLRRPETGRLGLVATAWRVADLDDERRLEDADGHAVRLIPG